MELKNKTVWITGASSGIGEALAKQFALNGADLILSARNETELMRVKNECNKHTDSCTTFPVDVTDYERVKIVFDKIISKYEKIDILVNNAGISQRSIAIDTQFDVDRKVMELNFFSQIYLAKLVLPGMIQQKSGRILVVSSVVGKFGFPLRSAYAASKHALHGFFEALMIENQNNGIKISFVVPGRVKTNISINAVVGDGSKHGEMDEGQEKGIDADVAARKIIKGIKSDKHNIIIAREERILLFLHRFFPSIFYKIAGKVSSK